MRFKEIKENYDGLKTLQSYNDDKNKNEKFIQILKDYKKFKESTTLNLKEVIKRSNKIIDLKELNRTDMINNILTDKYGNKNVTIAFKLLTSGKVKLKDL